MKKQAEPTSKGQYECILLAPYHKCGLGFCDKSVAGNNYDKQASIYSYDNRRSHVCPQHVQFWILKSVVFMWLISFVDPKMHLMYSMAWTSSLHKRKKVFIIPNLE